MLHPPKLARWLLSQLGCSPLNEAVIGDLDERYRQGHTRLLYWRQALAAIVSGIVTLVRNNQRLAIRALAIGWGLIFLSTPALTLALRILRGDPAGTGLLPASWTKVEWLFAFAIGWLVGRFNRPNQRQAIAIFLASWLALFLIAIPAVLLQVVRDWSASGWRYDNPYFFAFGVTSSILAMLSALADGLVS